MPNVVLYRYIITPLMETTSKPSANLIQGMLRLKDNNQAIGPLKPARSTDAITLQEIAKNIAQGAASSRHLMLTTGFGLHRNLKIPVRLPALAIPGLNVMERMQDAGLPVPTYLLYQATDFIAETNQLPLDESRECATRMEMYLRKYIERFHSRVAEHVVIKFGCEYPANVRESVTAIIEDIRLRMQDSILLQEAMKEIRGYGSSHSNGENHFDAYTAANVCYSGATEKYPFSNDQIKDVHTILPIGGIKEKRFFEVTGIYSDSLQTRKIIPMITPIGVKPTYYLYPQSGDPASISEYDEAMQKPINDGPIRTDINAMRADGATPEQISRIYPQQK